MRSRPSQLRDLLLIVLPVLLIVVGAHLARLALRRSAAARHVRRVRRQQGQPLHRYAERYQATFKRNGVKLEVRESGGSFANLEALSDRASGVHAGFVQGGLASSKDKPGLLSVGRVAYEPLWVFYAGSAKLERLTDLKGKRILVGPAGGGTSGLALRLLAANGITGRNRDVDQPRAAGLCRHARQGRGGRGLSRARGRGEDHPAAAAGAQRRLDELCQRRRLHPALSLPVAPGAARGRRRLRRQHPAGRHHADRHHDGRPGAGGRPPRARQPPGAGAARGARPARDRRRQRGPAVSARRRVPDRRRSRVPIVGGGAARLPLGRAVSAALRAVLGRHHGRPPAGVAGRPACRS